MALSQIQCLDNNNVNWRSSENKPEFFYSEEQRLAIEALVSIGPEAFQEVIKKENIRDFLSGLELGKLVSSVEPFDPDSGHTRTGCDKCPQTGNDHKNEGEVGESLEDAGYSLEYWPDKSDCAFPELDLGWPDTVAYRGVTRATVYMQPPIEAQPHIKEVVRKMIVQAQKHLRVRIAGGAEFYTRFSSKFKGCLSQKFMFVDGDKAICGSYSFTWSAARMDRNLATVLSGQVVESFDRQFQELYLMSKGVSLKDVPMIEEPEPELVAKPASMPVGATEAIAKKLVNPKYALVKTKSPSDKEKELKLAAANRLRILDQQNEESQIHPALQNMEKANMFDYLPTWVEPEPEPGSDILGYINIIDPNIKNAQLSQMNRIKICDTSQATAQFLQQSKDQEMRQSQQQEDIRNPPQDTKVMSSIETVDGHKRTTSPSSSDKDSVNSSKRPVSEFSRQDEDLTKPAIKDQITVTQKPNHDPKVYKAPVGGLALLAENSHLVSTSKGSGPPVPKPRTLQVTDFITRRNAHNVVSDNPKDENTVPSVNGVDTEENDHEEIEDFLPPNEPLDDDEDEDTNGFGTVTHDCSSSGSGSLPPSDASTISEEHYPNNSVQRRSSDRIPNGERYPLERKLSDGHISRGTFSGPMGIPQSHFENRQVENGKRNQALADGIKRVLSKGQQSKSTEQIFAAEPTKGKGIFNYGTSGFTQGYDRFQTQHMSRNPGKVKGNKEGSDVLGLYRQAGRKVEGPGGTHGYWNSKDYGNSLASSHSQNPVPTDNTSTPFGIPYSKLSQAKHLKSKLGATTLDSKRKGHGPTGHKDV
uniref:Family with sequence similarity 83 member G n=1 Tax=Leptobrachium leishanense TaxID=445787 RepID=A0A8C5PQL6_9ANUR